MVHWAHSLAGRNLEGACAEHVKNWPRTGSVLKNVVYEPIDKADPWVPEGVTRAEFYGPSSPYSD
jgi:hypothetical protein